METLMNELDSLIERLKTEKNPIQRTRIEQKINNLKNDNSNANSLEDTKANNYVNQAGEVYIINDKIDPEKKAEFQKRLNSLEHIYKKNNDADVLNEIIELKQELANIEQFERKNYAMTERISIMEEANAPKDEIVKHLKTQMLATDLTNIEFIPASEWFAMHGMRLDPEHGVLVGYEARYGV